MTTAVGFHLYEVPGAVNFIETKSRRVGEGRNGELVFNVYRVSVGGRSKSSGDG